MIDISLSDIPESFRVFAAPLLDRPDAGSRLVELLGTTGSKAPHDQAAAFALMLRRSLPLNSRYMRVTDAFLRKSYPAWYIRAVNDHHRNSAYRQAIETAVTPESIVLEAGTGSGLFAMLAARAGARHVYACELDPLVAEFARVNIDRNGLSDRITVLGRYEEVELGTDMAARADILIHEFVSPEFVTPGMGEMIAGLRERLLTTDARILPQEIGARGMLVGDKRFEEAVRVPGIVEGLDISAINQLSTPLAYFPGPAEVNEPLSAAFSLAEHNLSSGLAPARGIQTMSVKTTGTGTAQGILQWVRHGFPGGSVYENLPQLRCNWSPIFRPFDTPAPVRAGQLLEIQVETTETEVFIDLVDERDR